MTAVRPAATAMTAEVAGAAALLATRRFPRRLGVIGRKPGRGDEGMVRHHRQRPAGHPLDVAQIAALLGAAEGECRAAGARARGAPDAMDIALRHVRDLVV